MEKKLKIIEFKNLNELINKRNEIFLILMQFIESLKENNVDGYQIFLSAHSPLPNEIRLLGVGIRNDPLDAFSLSNTTKFEKPKKMY